jgi:D-threo-aldose 1-dehydrogenase
MTSALQRRRVGQSLVCTTVLGLGGAPLGNLYAPLDEEAALGTIRAALAAGVGYFDTAPQYGHGVSEHRFGNVLHDAPRDGFVLSTKVGRLLRPWRGAGPVPSVFRRTQAFEIVQDYSYDATMRSLEDSYNRLGMARIDIALIHDVDLRHQGKNYDRCFDQAINGAVRALQELKAAGIVGAIGIGVNDIEPCVQFAEAVALDAYMLAGRFTLLEQSGLTRLFGLAAVHGFSLIIAGPYNSGILATGATDRATYDYRQAGPEVLDRVRRLDSVCATYDVPLAAVALQFPLLQPSVCSVVTGAVTAEEITQNARLMAMAIPNALWRDLGGAGFIAPEFLPEART